MARLNLTLARRGAEVLERVRMRAAKVCGDAESGMDGAALAEREQGKAGLRHFPARGRKTVGRVCVLPLGSAAAASF